MGANSQTINKHLSSIEEKCKKLQSLILSPLEGEEQESSRRSTQLFDLANRIKELVDTPERIWVALEQHDYIVASNMYLQAFVLHDSLLKGSHARKLLNSIPLLARQWATINQFPAKIRNQSRLRLLENNVTAVDFARALYSLIQLDGLSIKDAFIQFLDSRKEALKTIITTLEREDNLTTEQSGEKVSQLVQIIQQSIQQVASMFVSCEYLTNRDREKLFESQFDLTNQTVSLLEHLLQRDEHFSRKESDFLRTQCTEWFTQCKSMIQQAERLLQSFTSSEKLIQFERTIWEQIQSDMEYHVWCSVCQLLINDVHVVDLWVSTFHHLFLQQSKRIVQQKLDSLSITDAVEQAWTKYSEPLSLHSSGTGSNISNSGSGHLIGSSSSSNGQVLSTGHYVWDYDNDHPPTLSDIKQKAKGIPASMADVVLYIDQQIASILAELQHMTTNNNNNNNNNIANSGATYSGLKTTSFNATKQKSITELKQYIQSQGFLCISSIIHSIGKHIDEEIKSYTSNNNNNNTNNNENVFPQRILFLSQLCEAISLLSNDVPVLFPPTSSIGSSSNLSAFSPASSSASSFSYRSSKLQKNIQRVKIEEACHLQYLKGFSLWARVQTQQLLQQFSDWLASEDWTSTTLRKSCWSTVEISVSTGAPAKEVIKVPTFPSPFISHFLFSICKMCHDQAAHFIHPTVIRYIAQLVSLSIPGLYKQLFATTKKVSRESLVQILYDVRFLFDLLSCAFDQVNEWPALLVEATASSSSHSQTNVEESVKKQTAEFISFLKQQFEPIDLAFYEPRVQANVQKSYLQSLVSFSYLTNIHRLYSQSTAVKLSADRPNVIPLAPAAARFPTLPIGSKRK